MTGDAMRGHLLPPFHSVLFCTIRCILSFGNLCSCSHSPRPPSILSLTRCITISIRSRFARFARFSPHPSTQVQSLTLTYAPESAFQAQVS